MYRPQYRNLLLGQVDATIFLLTISLFLCYTSLRLAAAESSVCGIRLFRRFVAWVTLWKTLGDPVENSG